MKKAGNAYFVILAAILGCCLCCHCVPYLPESEAACPCRDGWKCCAEETGEDLCVPANESCPCAGARGDLIAGEMVLSSDRLTANGQLEAEVVVWVFEALCEHRPPVVEADIVIHSSRNEGDDGMDMLEQPTHPTDADGRVVAFIGSGTPGEAVLAVLIDDTELCKTWIDGECVEPLQAVVTFNP